MTVPSGDGRIIAWAVNTAHHADFADRGHAHIYQEGLRIPPIRLYRAGKLQKDVQELILLNCQVPRERLSDLRAQMAANRLGVQRMQALCSKYGTETVLAVGHRPERRASLGLSRNNRRRLGRARWQRWARRRSCPHDQHIEPASRGA
jgi:N-methylhydantoinase B/oxoprolinase/acetone carboxylase alpha subunit